MKRKSRRLNWLKQSLQWRADEAKTPTLRNDYKYLKKIAREAEEEIDEMLRDAEMQGIRNPAFPDDLVGWLDDDFIIEEEDTYRGRQRKKEREEEEAKKKAEEEAKNKKDADDENKT